MQISFENITYDNKYIYALGVNLLTGVKKRVVISRINDKDFRCEGGYETVFYRGAVCLMCELNEKNCLPKEKSYMWEH